MAGPHDFTPEELALLSPSELEGLKDPTLIDEGELDDDAQPGAAADKAIEHVNANAPPAEEEKKPDGTEADDDADPTDPAAAAADPAAGEPDAAAAAAAAAVESPTIEDVEAPPTPVDYQAKIVELEAQQLALAQKANDGEITLEEYEAQRRPLEKQVTQLTIDEKLDPRTPERRLATYLDSTVPTFLDEHKDIYQGNDTATAMLDTRVRQLQVEAEKAGKDPFSPKILAKAHEAVTRDMDALVARLTGKPAPKRDNPSPTPAPKQQQTQRNLPPAMHEVPAAESADDIADGGRWAYLDRLADKDPAEYETALARLSETDREAYLRA